MSLYGVNREEIDEWWPQIRHLVEKPLVRTGVIADFSPEDVRDLIRSGDMQCWIGHSDGKILVCGITEIMVYPRRKVLGIPFVGAEDGSIALWLAHIETLKDFARHHGCEIVRGWGRKGWVRALRPDHERVEFDIEV